MNVITFILQKSELFSSTSSQYLPYGCVGKSDFIRFNARGTNKNCGNQAQSCCKVLSIEINDVFKSTECTVDLIDQECQTLSVKEGKLFTKADSTSWKTTGCIDMSSGNFYNGYVESNTLNPNHYGKKWCNKKVVLMSII